MIQISTYDTKMNNKMIKNETNAYLTYKKTSKIQYFNIG